MAKRSENTTQFCVIPRKSIKLLAESVGIHYLSSEGAGLLAEDISYRIRQTVQSAVDFAKHSRRDHLTGEDINRALLWSRVEPIYGYGSKNSNVFSSISTKDGDIFYHEEKEVNLRELTFSKGLSTLNELGDSHSKINIEISLLDNNDGSLTFDALSEAYKSYYNQVTKNIIEADKSIVKTVLADLKTNPRIQVFLPYLVNFISKGIKVLIGNVEKVLRLLALVKTLVDNRNIYLEPWVVQFVRAVMYCVVEKPAAPMNCATTLDSWMLRNRAVQILCHIDRKCSNSGNYLHHQLLRTFKDIYEDKERPLYSQYGAIVGIYMLGLDAVEQTILPNFKTYVEHLESLRHSDSSDELNYIVHALKCSVLSLFRSKLRIVADIAAKQSDLEKSSSSEVLHKSSYLDHSKLTKDIVTWYKHGYELFGEDFVLQAGQIEDFQNIVHSTPPVATVHRLHSQTSNMPYIRHLIKDALVTTVKTNFKDCSAFLLPVKKRRLDKIELSKRDDGTEGGLPCKLQFLSDLDSEIRFDDLVQKTYKNKTINWKYYVGKCRHSKQSCMKPKLFSLSFL